MWMRIYPTHHPSKSEQQSEDGAKRLTVWKRSSMSFHGTDGFTVFDERGRLVFRVDNYSRNRRSDVVLLMDGVGNALLTLKPRTQMGVVMSEWNGYRGDGRRSSRVFSMRTSRSSLIFQGKKEQAAEVFMNANPNAKAKKGSAAPDFRIKGSFMIRSCKITDSRGQTAATIARKSVMNSTVLLGDDVFTLSVHPAFDAQLIMAFVLVLDRISAKRFSPFLCS